MERESAAVKHPVTRDVFQVVPEMSRHGNDWQDFSADLEMTVGQFLGYPY